MATEGADESKTGVDAPKLYRNYVNGEFLPASDGTTIEVINPATNQVTGLIPRSKAADVEAAVAAAKAAFAGEWRKTSYVERAAMLDKIADAIEARSEELVLLESQDSGKTVSMAGKVDIPRAVSNFRFYAGQVRHMESDSHAMADAINYTVQQPMGVCGLITPWNLPLYLLSWKVAPALAMGNTIVAKPSELTPRTASVLAEIIHSVGLPKGVFNLVQGLGAEVGAALTGHPDVPCVSFTGGTATGKLVAATAAPMFKKLSLELGGKNPAIVFADCDFDKTVAGVVRAGFLNQGQVCLAGSRIFVERPIAERFTQALVKELQGRVVGDPSHPDTFFGPLSSHVHREKVESYVKLAVEEGGTIACGGKRPELPAPFCDGAFFEPTVVTGLPPTARTSCEEIFGPVVTVHPFDTEEEVVAWANNVKYGLAGSVWTSNLQRGHRVAHSIDAGILWVNCWLHRDLRTPFGGMKDSGTGREGGKYSLEFYSETKNVCIYLGRP